MPSIARIYSTTVLLGLLLVAFKIAPAQEMPIAFMGARIIPINEPEIADGTIVIQNGKILSVGPSSTASIPADAERINQNGNVIMPGIIDSHSHIGGVDGADSSAPIQPDIRILDSINVRDARIQKAQAGGITTVHVVPGSGHLLSGQTLYLKLRDGTTIDDLLIHNDDGSIAGGIKMANGTNPFRSPPFPSTRAKAAALVREQYIKAQEYREKLSSAENDPDKKPSRDLRMEALVEALEGKRVVHFHTHRHDDILTVLRLKQEFGFRVVLHHVSDAWMVAGEIAKANVQATIILLDSPGGKLEAKDIQFRNGAALEAAGVLVGFHTDDGINGFPSAPASGWTGDTSRHVARECPPRPNHIQCHYPGLTRPRRISRTGKRCRFSYSLGRPSKRLHKSARNLGGRQASF